MDLRSDDSGFLIGGSRIGLSLDKERLLLLRAIKADTAALRKTLTDSVSSARVARNPAPASNIAARAARVARAPANDSGQSYQQQAQERSVSVRRVREQRNEEARAATPQRGANGRFLAGTGGAEAQAQAKSGQRKLLAGIGGIMASLKSGLGRLGGGGGNGESVDPTIAAAKELGGIMSPITRPFKGLMGMMFRRRPADAEQKISVPWYRRIWSELRGINQKSGAGGGRSLLGGIGGAIGALLGRIPGLGMLGKGLGMLGGRGRRSGGRDDPRAAARARLARRNARNRAAGGRSGGLGRAARSVGGLLSRIPGLGMLAGRDDPRAAARARLARRNGTAGGGLSRLGGSVGRMAKSAGGALGGLGAGFLKKIPLLGALLSGGTALASIFGVGGGTKEDRFKGAGGGIGALIGGGIGTLLGPIGTVVGGMLGDLVGTKIGEWLSGVDWGKVGETITQAWDGLTGTISDGWKWVEGKFGGVLDAVSSTISGIKDTIVNAAGSAIDWTKEKAGVAKEAVKAAAQAVAAKAAPAVNAVKEKAGSIYEAATLQGGRLMGKLDKSYRHKEKFDGIKGGEGLAKYGTYTNDEADRIRELKKSGANTSANLKGGMPQDIRNKIIAQATAAGLDPEQMLQIAALESGGNPNAISSTGATGVYQMTGQTATGLGITNRFDADQNIAGGMKLAQANAESLRKRGLAVNRDNLYMMHQLGPKAATDLIQGAAQGKNLNELSAGTQTAAGMNYGKGAKTAKEYLAKNSMALDARLGQVSKTVPATLAAVTPASAAAKASAVPMVASAAASLEKQSLAPVPTPPRKIADNSKKAEPVGVMAAPLTQNIADRGLAQAATGGIGMNLGAR